MSRNFQKSLSSHFLFFGFCRAESVTSIYRPPSSSLVDLTLIKINHFACGPVICQQKQRQGHLAQYKELNIIQDDTGRTAGEQSVLERSLGRVVGRHAMP